MEARHQAIAELQGNLKGLAGKLAPHYYRDLTNRVEGRTLKRFAEAPKSSDVSAQPAASSQGKNGRNPVREYDAENLIHVKSYVVSEHDRASKAQSARQE